MPPITERITADALRPGDRFRYIYPGSGKPEGFATVASVDLFPSINPKFPDHVFLQVEHPQRGRIACSFTVNSEVEVISSKPVGASRTAIQWAKSLSTGESPSPARKKRKRLVARSGNALLNFFKKFVPSDYAESAQGDLQSSSKPRIKRKKKRS